jgi:hypothetical protein
MFAILIILTLFGAVAVLAARYGRDSRETITSKEAQLAIYGLTCRGRDRQPGPVAAARAGWQDQCVARRHARCGAMRSAWLARPCCGRRPDATRIEVARISAGSSRMGNLRSRQARGY